MSDTTNIETYLKSCGSLTYSFKGTSMLPLLRQGRDLVTIRRKGKRRCKRGDVVLYRLNTDKYVLHRIVEVLPDSYIILGDNCISREHGITDNDIIGVMTSFSRGGKIHSVNEPLYKLYTAFWLAGERPRVLFKRARIHLKRLFKKII